MLCACGRRERLQTGSKTRDLAGCRVGVKDALACGACQFRLRCEEGFLSLGSVAGCECLFDLADERANARATSLVDVGAAGDLAGRFFRRSCIGHGCLSKEFEQNSAITAGPAATIYSNAGA